MKKIMFSIAVLYALSITAQLGYENPNEEPLPKKLQDLPKMIQVNNFPKKIDAIKIGENYYWKHNTAILSKESKIEIIEFGAYLFYNDQWNLRKSYQLKELNKNFGTKKQILKRAQPYTWNNNWRIGPKLFGGWALWYFIGKNTDGTLVCGYEKIETTANLLKK